MCIRGYRWKDTCWYIQSVTALRGKVAYGNESGQEEIPDDSISATLQLLRLRLLA